MFKTKYIKNYSENTLQRVYEIALYYIVLDIKTNDNLKSANGTTPLEIFMRLFGFNSMQFEFLVNRLTHWSNEPSVEEKVITTQVLGLTHKESMEFLRISPNKKYNIIKKYKDEDIINLDALSNKEEFKYIKQFVDSYFSLLKGKSAILKK